MRPLPLLAMFLCACAGSAPAHWDDPATPYDRIEFDDDDGVHTVLGYGDDHVDASSLHVLRDVAIVELAVGEDRLSVATTPGDGAPLVRIERDAWLLEWTGDGPLPDGLEDEWLPVVARWHGELVDRDGFLRTPYADAINLDPELEPLVGVTAAEWRAVCPTLSAWSCASPSPASTLGCEIAGAAFCSALDPGSR